MHETVWYYKYIQYTYILIYVQIQACSVADSSSPLPLPLNSSYCNDIVTGESFEPPSFFCSSKSGKMRGKQSFWISHSRSASQLEFSFSEPDEFMASYLVNQIKSESGVLKSSSHSNGGLRKEDFQWRYYPVDFNFWSPCLYLSILGLLKHWAPANLFSCHLLQPKGATSFFHRDWELEEKICVSEIKKLVQFFFMHPSLTNFSMINEFLNWTLKFLFV